MFELIDSDGKRYYFFTAKGQSQFIDNFLAENKGKDIRATGRIVPIAEAIAYEKGN